MINKSVLDNGIRVITERIPSIHSVALGIWVQHGSRHEPITLNGCSHFIEHMLFKGTASRSAHAIAKEIDAAGGMLNAFTSREYSCYYAKVLSESLPLAVDLCAAGDLEHQQMVDLVQAALEKLPSDSRLSEQPLPATCCGVDVETGDLEQVHVCLAAPGYPQNHPDRYPLYLFNTILGGSMSSRLFQRVREEHGLAYSIYSYLNGFSDCGSQVIYAGVSPGDVHEAVDLILREIRELCMHPVSDEELVAARNQLKGNLLLSLENSDNRMSRLAKDEIYFGESLPVEEVVTAIDAVSAREITEVASLLMHGEQFHLQLMGNVREHEFGQLDLCFDVPRPH